MQCSSPWFLPLALLIFSCQPEEDDLSPQNVAKSYEHVQAQQQEVERRIEIMANRYLDEHKNPKQPFDSATAIRRFNSSPRLSNEDLFADPTLYKLHGLASDQDYQLLVNLVKQRNELQKKLWTLPDTYGIFVDQEVQPLPKGGMPVFYDHVRSNLRYPNLARQREVEGKVFVQFVVETDGSLSEIEAIKGIGFGCDQEAIRLVKQSSPWNPGTVRGKLMKVRMVLPIGFKRSSNDQ